VSVQFVKLAHVFFVLVPLFSARRSPDQYLSTSVATKVIALPVLKSDFLTLIALSAARAFIGFMYRLI